MVALLGVTKPSNFQHLLNIAAGSTLNTMMYLVLLVIARTARISRTLCFPRLANNFCQLNLPIFSLTSDVL